jgi:pimeloyl-ACP methyl ester carboxylesterase
MTTTTSGLHVTTWGAGPRAVLVHGGGAGGSVAFAAQRPLAEDHTLVLPDRPGAGGTPAQGRQDAERDGGLIAQLLDELGGEGAHLVGHSYGAVAVMVGAALRPQLVRSLVLIEPPVFQLAADDPVVRARWTELVDAIADPDPARRVQRFFAAAGLASPVSVPLPPPLQHLAAELRSMRQPWDVPLDLPALRDLHVRKTVVTGGHDDAYERLADRLADAIGADRVVLPGAGHAVQDTGEAFNALLRQVWS